jgi:hypothetical protein
MLGRELDPQRGSERQERHGDRREHDDDPARHRAVRRDDAEVAVAVFLQAFDDSGAGGLGS